MRVHFCSHNGCNEVIPIDSRYCQKHISEYKPYKRVTDTQRKGLQRAYNLIERDQKANSFYHDKKWTVTRQTVVVRDMHADAITGNVIPDNQLQVDHIVPRRLCKDPYDLNNLWCLSRINHTRKNKIEAHMSDSALKHVGRKWWIKVLKERFK
ncbi:hypothetical protein FD20_GL001153 [Liquorilactobacillus uvarum DSM 19971]|uniref:HNH endonuclease n=1 Tax=Liquorilactobacillus uvarum DSM 19971 TaxID=1423812 RepID=A0A0R1Q382_9LACO|nr:hypothetical protein FD20_GL001153 [Liquorilactobacillus uvarum DSM 19971]